MITSEPSRSGVGLSQTAMGFPPPPGRPTGRRTWINGNRSECRSRSSPRLSEGYAAPATGLPRGRGEACRQRSTVVDQRGPEVIRHADPAAEDPCAAAGARPGGAGCTRGRGRSARKRTRGARTRRSSGRASRGSPGSRPRASESRRQSFMARSPQRPAGPNVVGSSGRTASAESAGDRRRAPGS